jgi:hypothetical protein
MATEKQLNANRRNATKCTGPKSVEGKSKSSMNNLKHGVNSATLILPGEDESEFQRIHGEIQSLYQPQDSSQQLMVDQMAVARWKMRRAELFEAELMIERTEMDINVAIASYSRINQTQTRLERTWSRLYKELERIKAARQPPPPPPEKVVEKPAAPQPEKKWSTSKEWETMTPKERLARPLERVELSWTPVKGKPPVVISRIYRGERVDKFPHCGDPECTECNPQEGPAEK